MIDEAVAMPSQDVSPPSPVRIAIGSPQTIGYTHVPASDAFPLDIESGSVDEVYACHSLQMFGWAEWRDALSEWIRVLKPGGLLRVSVPGFKKTVDHYAKPEVQYAQNQGRYPHLGIVLMGDEHKRNNSLWDEGDLHVAMQQFGLVCVREFKSFSPDASAMGFSINVEGRRPTATSSRDAISGQIAIAMTAPRLGWNIQAMRIAHTCEQLRCPIYHIGGAYFDIGMEAAIRKALTSGCRYVLTVDYDTVFEPDDVHRLAMLMDNNPDVDCLAAIQHRRGDDAVLFSDLVVKHDAETLAREIVPVDSACFGLTLFRASSLSEFKSPWFRHRDVFDGDGNLTETLHADMHFWELWKASGRNVYISPSVRVGHIGDMIAWVDESYKPLYQHASEYDEKGRPDNAPWKAPIMVGKGASQYDVEVNFPGYEWLSDRRGVYFSQFGEDGVIAAIFEKIGTANRWCFEGGAFNGVTLSNVRALTKAGWSSVLVEPGDTLPQLNRVYASDPNAHIYPYHIGPGGVSLDDVLEEAGAPTDIDLVVVDIDGADYWTVRDMEKYTPRVLMVEYCCTADNPAGDMWLGTQVGLNGIKDLLEAKGYVPVFATYCNLIGVRKDLAEKLSM